MASFGSALLVSQPPLALKGSIAQNQPPGSNRHALSFLAPKFVGGSRRVISPPRRLASVRASRRKAVAQSSGGEFSASSSSPSFSPGGILRFLLNQTFGGRKVNEDTKQDLRMSTSCTSVDSSPSQSTVDDKVDEYNRNMRRAMKNPYEYHHELGMYYTPMTPSLIVGSQPQTPADIDRLADTEKVTHIINLQQDKDIAYWGVDFNAVRRRAEERNTRIIRRPARDFDPHSLRAELPGTVSMLEGIISDGGKAYVHCTAGLGRAPGVAIAYLYWFNDLDLKGAYEFVTSRRPCGPKWDAIRGATYDVVRQGHPWHMFDELPPEAFGSLLPEDRITLQERVRSFRRFMH